MSAYLVGYMRFSSKIQADGSSEERQETGYQAALKSTGLPAWHENYFDPGKSGYFGKHKEGRFGQLLADIEARKFPEGSVIWFEAQDRMSREDIDIVLSYRALIMRNGYRLKIGSGSIVDANTNPWETMGDIAMAIGANAFSRELQRKLKEANRIKREDGKTHLTKKNVASKACPSWLTPLDSPVNGYWFAFNDRAPIIREACMLSIGGMGVNTIRNHLGLTDDKQWGGLRTILTGSVGLYGMRQNCLKGKIKQGMTACYPPLITEAEFFAMRAAQRDRARNLGTHGGGGRGGQFATCLFTGKLFYADGTPMTLTSVVPS